MNKKKSGVHGLSVLTVTLTTFLSDFLKVSIEGEEGMGNLPVVHEVTTSFQSLGDAITGDLDGAANRWKTYAEQSVIGSGVYAAFEAARGNKERAIELGKGMGRATGSALLGGGLLRNVPVFHELATAGDSLGDVIGGGDTETAAQRWGDYAENSVIGSGVYAAVEAGKGNTDRAEELGKNMGKAAISAGITTAAVAATIATGGAAAPLGAAAAAGVGAAVGAGVGAGTAAAEQALRKDKIEAGDVLAAALMGGVGGAVGGGMAGRAAAGRAAVAADVANLAEVEAVAARMAAGEVHPAILAEIQAAEAAGAAEMAAMEAAGAGAPSSVQGSAAGSVAASRAGSAVSHASGAPSSVPGSAAGSVAASRAGSAVSRDLGAPSSVPGSAVSRASGAPSSVPGLAAGSVAASRAGSAVSRASGAPSSVPGSAAGSVAASRAGSAVSRASGAPSSVPGPAAGSVAASRAGSAVSRASDASSISFISSDSTILYFEQGNNLAEGLLIGDDFEFMGGSAVRDLRFRDVWRPQRPGNQLDRSAAHEGARRDAQVKANGLSARQRPGMVAVVQDKAGNALGGHSVRGDNNQGILDGRLTNCQRSVLERIPDGSRGAGHGNCAEQVITQNLRHIQYRQQQGVPQLFTGEGNVVTAYRRARGAQQYDVPTPACNTCRVTNQFFGLQDGAGPQ